MPKLPRLTSKRWKAFALAATFGIVGLAWVFFGMWSAEFKRSTGEAAIPSEAKVPALAVRFEDEEVGVVSNAPVVVEPSAPTDSRESEKVTSVETERARKPLIGGAPIGFAPGALDFDREVATPPTGKRPRERAVRGESTVQMRVTPPEIRAEIERRSGAFVAAYERALKDQPALEGTIDVAFTLEKDGSLSDVVVVRDEVGSREINQRVVEAMSTWRLPPPAGGAMRVKTPIQFKQK